MAGTSQSHYSIKLQWSPEDACYVVFLPEFEGQIEQPCTHGPTRQEALQQAEDLLAEIEAVYAHRGKLLPQPALLEQR